MRLEELEHIIRAAATIANDDEIVVVGSQAILASYPNAPDELLVSDEADVFPLNRPERADLIDGSIGELSPFHETFGYYAQGVGETTAVVPNGWKERLVRLQSPATRGAIGWCLEPHDLIVAKLIAGRDKDLRYCRDALRHELVDSAKLVRRLADTPLDEQLRPLVEARLARLVASKP